jgi:hypothetical protein
MKIKYYFFGFTIIFTVTLAIVVSAQDLYTISTKEIGISSFDYTVTEIKRTERLSVLRIPGFHERSAAAARWMKCVYNDLAQKRGFKFLVVVYPTPPSDDLIVGFPQSETEDIAHTLGPEFATRKALIMPVQCMITFCGTMDKRK